MTGVRRAPWTSYVMGISFVNIAGKNSTVPKRMVEGCIDRFQNNLPEWRENRVVFYTTTTAPGRSGHLWMIGAFGIFRPHRACGIPQIAGVLMPQKTLVFCRYLLVRCLNPQISPEKEFRGSKHLLTRYLEDFGCLGNDQCADVWSDSGAFCANCDLDARIRQVTKFCRNAP